MYVLKDLWESAWEYVKDLSFVVCKGSLTIGSAGAVLKSHQNHFCTDKSAGNACTTNCKILFMVKQYNYVPSPA